MDLKTVKLNCLTLGEFWGKLAYFFKKLSFPLRPKLLFTRILGKMRILTPMYMCVCVFNRSRPIKRQN